MRNKPIVMVVEDDKAASDALSAMLEAADYRSLPLNNGREAISLAASHCPDLILLTPELPDIDGMEVLTTLRNWSSVPVIIVSARYQDDDIVQALDCGANDFIPKPYSPAVLMARVRAALRQRTPSVSTRIQLFDSGRLCIDYDKRLILLDGQRIHLTPIEYKILVLLAKNAGRVIPYAVIRQELWGPYAGDNPTLRVNMANLRRKLEPGTDNPRYIQTEVGVGYRMMDSMNPEPNAAQPAATLPSPAAAGGELKNNEKQNVKTERNDAAWNGT